LLLLLLRWSSIRRATHLVQASLNASDQPVCAIEEIHKAVPMLVQLVIVTFKLGHRWHDTAHQHG
jgi:hypothetical protein